MSATATPLCAAVPIQAQEASKNQNSSAVFEDCRVVKLPKGTYGYRGMPGSFVQLKDGRMRDMAQRRDGAGTAAPAQLLRVEHQPHPSTLLIRSSDDSKEPPRIRTPFVSVLSENDGVTWTRERVIMGDPEGDYGYPSLIFVGDLAVISHRQRDGLNVARIGIGWFYGK